MCGTAPGCQGIIACRSFGRGSHVAAKQPQKDRRVNMNGPSLSGAPNLQSKGAVGFLPIGDSIFLGVTTGSDLLQQRIEVEARAAAQIVPMGIEK
jgi:hypothetical protein